MGRALVLGFVVIVLILGHAPASRGQTTQAIHDAAAVLMDDRADDGAKLKAIESIVNTGPPAADAVPALIKTLESKSPTLRHDAVVALKNIGSAAFSSVQGLGAVAMDDPDPALRQLATEAMNSIQGQTAPARAQSTPPPPANDPPPPSAAGADFSGTFTGDGIVLMLSGGSSGYTGSIRSNGQEYPATAHRDGNQLAGRFAGGGASFDFTAHFDGDALVFATGQSQRRLTRGGGAAGLMGLPMNPPAVGGGMATGRDAGGGTTGAGATHLVEPENAGPGVLAPGMPAGGDQPAPNLGAIGTLLPSLATAPAPPWLKPGVRLTYKVASASVAGMGHNWTQDPEGNYVGPDGQRYSPVSKMGSGGAGVAEMTIAAMDRRTVAVSSRILGLVNGTGPLTVLSQTGFFAAPGAGGDYWASPAALATLHDMRQQGLMISHGPYAIGDKKFDAVFIKSNTTRNESIWVYDTQTGLMLHSASTVEEAPSAVVDPTEPVSATQMLSTTTLLNVREMAVPWSGQAPPDWVGNLKRINFTGAMTVVIPGAPVVPMEMYSRVAVTGRGPNWLSVNTTDGMAAAAGFGDQGSTSPRVYGTDQLDGLWIPPAALARLRPGQTMDQDPATGITTTVGADGGDRAVELIEDCQGFESDIFYDRTTGMEISARYVDKTMNRTVEMRVQAAE